MRRKLKVVGSDLYSTLMIPLIILPSRNEIEGKDCMGVHVLPFKLNVTKLVINRFLARCIMLDIPSLMPYAYNMYQVGNVALLAFLQQNKKRISLLFS